MLLAVLCLCCWECSCLGVEGGDCPLVGRGTGSGHRGFQQPLHLGSVVAACGLSSLAQYLWHKGLIRCPQTKEDQACVSWRQAFFTTEPPEKPLCIVSKCIGMWLYSHQKKERDERGKLLLLENSSWKVIWVNLKFLLWFKSQSVKIPLCLFARISHTLLECGWKGIHNFDSSCQIVLE